MTEVLSFWLDNKMVSAHKSAEIGEQLLVEYRGKFYVVKNGSAMMKGSRPLHYSKSSMPAIWKKAMRGDIIPASKLLVPEDENMPQASITKRIRVKKEKETLPMPETSATPSNPEEIKPVVKHKTSKPLKANEIKLAPQAVVAAQCPYCGQKQDIPVEKGKSGKPFFYPCNKCSVDFAVRFVPVTIFQAQTAGFR